MNAFSYRIQHIRQNPIPQILTATANPDLIDFATGRMAKEAMQTEKIRVLSDGLFQTNADEILNYSYKDCYEPLMKWLKADLQVKYIYRRNDDHIVLTNGVQQALELAAKCICNEGETVIVPVPCYEGALNVFRSYGAKIVGVDSDSEGMKPELLDEALRQNQRTAFVYVMPNYCNPTGITLSEERRKQILEIAYRRNVLILEDDTYGAVSFFGDNPSIKSVATRGNVLYASSFSNSIAPSVRVGYLCGEEKIMKAVKIAQQESTLYVSMWNQMLVYRYLTMCNYEEELENLQNICKRKCDLMLNSLKYKMPSSIDFTEPDGGIYIWATLPDGDLQYFCKKALTAGVAVVPGNYFLPDTNLPYFSFRLCFTTPTDSEIERGVDILSDIAKTMYK